MLLSSAYSLYCWRIVRFFTSTNSELAKIHETLRAAYTPLICISTGSACAQPSRDNFGAVLRCGSVILARMISSVRGSKHSACGNTACHLGILSFAPSSLTRLALLSLLLLPAPSVPWLSLGPSLLRRLYFSRLAAQSGLPSRTPSFPSAGGS
jgi:hypothetical protein